jgi:hypothetical protein
MLLGLYCMRLSLNRIIKVPELCYNLFARGARLMREAAKWLNPLAENAPSCRASMLTCGLRTVKDAGFNSLQLSCRDVPSRGVICPPIATCQRADNDDPINTRSDRAQNDAAQARRSSSALATASGQPASIRNPRCTSVTPSTVIVGGLTDDGSVFQLHFTVHAMRRGRQLQHRCVLAFR